MSARARVAAKNGGSTKLSFRDKQLHLAEVLSDRTGVMRRLGQGMIGPIQLKLRYQGVVRNVLLEDSLTPGIPIEYDILEELGQDYVLHPNEGVGEVKVTPFEGKKAPVRLVRVATFPQIKNAITQRTPLPVRGGTPAVLALPPLQEHPCGPGSATPLFSPCAPGPLSAYER